MSRIIWFQDLGMNDVPVVGGKNASLGEMIRSLAASGVRVPGGFATTADAYREFAQANGLSQRIAAALEGLNVDDVAALARAGSEIRGWIEQAPLGKELEDEVRQAYVTLCAGDNELSVAVRSSATAEDLPEASFAGQQETFLNVRGIDAVLRRIREVFASLFNNRAIAYRVHQNFEHMQVALSAGIQRMVRSDLACSGVLFTLDTESGFRDVVFVTSAWGLGELVVQGQVNPDEFYVWKKGLAQGKPAVLRRELGSKALRMVYAASGDERVLIEEVKEADQQRFSLDDADVQGDRSNSRHFLDSWTHVPGPIEADQELEKRRGARYYARVVSAAWLTADSPAA